MNKKVRTVFSIAVSTLFMVAIVGGTAVANETTPESRQVESTNDNLSVTTASDDNHGSDLTGPTGGISGIDFDSASITSRNVATIVCSVQYALDNLGSIIDAPAINAGSTNFEATAGVSRADLELQDPNATVWINVAYANHDVTVTEIDPITGETTTRTISENEVLGPVAIGSPDSWGATGYKDPNAAADLMKGLESMGIDTTGLLTQSLADTLADYDRLVAEGIRKDHLDDGVFLFVDELEKQGLLKDLTEEEKEELMEILEELLCPGGECKTKPKKPASNPNCHDADNWGDTFGEANVQNMTVGTGWKEEVWARPGDTIQFKIYYCWGAEAVAGANNSESSPFANTEKWVGVDNIYFQLSAKQNDKYLFGENAQEIGTERHVLKTPHNDTIGAATAGGVKNSSVDSTGDYEFTLYSPGTKDGSNYNCMIFDFSPHFVSFGYQIPGVDTGSCAAIGQTGVMSDVSNDFGVISQSIQYDRVQAWKLWKHNEQGECDSCCPYTDDTAQAIQPCASKSDNVRNGMTRQNINIRSNPFPTLEAAKGAGGTHWGLVNKWQGDNNPHYHDCASQQCGCTRLSWITSSGCSATCSMGWYNENVNMCVDQNGPVGYVIDWSPRTQETGCSRAGVTHAYSNCKGGNITSTCSCKQRATRYLRDTNIDYSTEYGAVHPVNKGTETKEAKVNVPYSYRTAANSYLNEGEVVYLGQTVTSTFTVNILPRVVTEVRPSEAYATLVDGFIQAVEFIADDIPGGGGVAPVPVPGDNLCNYFASSACREIWHEGPKLNKEGRYRGADYSHQSLNVIPDDKDDLVGKKYCVAVGISTADSHGQVDAEVVSGMSSPSAWRISGVSCRTIAKKPNFQVWNGGLYTNGSIKTSATYKNVGVSLGGNTDPTGVFGSWEEYYVVAAKDVRNFASGAALGYYPSLRPRGGKDPGALTSYCDATKKTISNENCSSGVSGNSGIYNTSQQIILERVYSRYAIGGDPTSLVGRKLDNGARYIYKSANTDDIRISDVVSAFKSSEMYNSDSKTYYCNYGSNALKMCQGESANVEQTTSNYADGTLIIHTRGKVIIDRNICYGDGACNTSSDVRLGNNSEYFTSMYGLPQVVIIAEKGIDITASATHVDAWLVTNGSVNTCTNFSMGAPQSACNSTLIVNGPVFANSMSLNRVGGAYPGAGSGSTVLNTNLSRTGSITPGEIFNLRPDTLYWAYSQAQRFSQATATYTRELAPRY